MNKKGISWNWFWMIAFLIFVAGEIMEPSYEEMYSERESYNRESYQYKETMPETAPCICSYNAYDCADFKSKAEAQLCFQYCGGKTNDIHRLDEDKDGLVCEWL